MQETVGNIDLHGKNCLVDIVKPFFKYCSANSSFCFFPPPLRLTREITRENTPETWCIEPDWRLIRDLPVPGAVLTYLDSLTGVVAPIFAINCEKPVHFAEHPGLEFRVFTMIVNLDREYYIPKIEMTATTSEGGRLNCIRYFNNNPRDTALFCLLVITDFIHLVAVHGDDATSMVTVNLPVDVQTKLEQQLDLWASSPCPKDLFNEIVIDQLVTLEQASEEFKGNLLDYYMFTDPFRREGTFTGLSVLEPVIEEVRERMAIT